MNLKCPVGTRSLLFGAHQFLIHPFFVLKAWVHLFGWPREFPIYVAILVHDWGYWNSPDIDGPYGRVHPEVGAHWMAYWFDETRRILDFDHPRGLKWVKNRWRCFTLYHSRWYADRDGHQFSRLCVADKLALTLSPSWWFVPAVILSGEYVEYCGIDRKNSNIAQIYKQVKAWHGKVKAENLEWALKNKEKAYVGASDSAARASEVS